MLHVELAPPVGGVLQCGGVHPLEGTLPRTGNTAGKIGDLSPQCPQQGETRVKGWTWMMHLDWITSMWNYGSVSTIRGGGE